MSRHVIYPVKAASIVAMAALFSAGTVTAAEEQAVRCLQTSTIQDTRVIDDQNIVFKTNGNRFYNNHLPHRCSGLKSANKFSYTTSLSVLCNVDIITVLENFGGSMARGAGCGLGEFTPIPDPDKKDKEKDTNKDKAS